MKCSTTSIVSLAISDHGDRCIKCLAPKVSDKNADNNLNAIETGGNMKLRSDKKFFRQTSFIVLSVSALIVVATCAYYGFNISGIGGGAFGAFVGLTISGC